MPAHIYPSFWPSTIFDTDIRMWMIMRKRGAIGVEFQCLRGTLSSFLPRQSPPTASAHDVLTGVHSYWPDPRHPTIQPRHATFRGLGARINQLHVKKRVYIIPPPSPLFIIVEGEIADRQFFLFEIAAYVDQSINPFYAFSSLPLELK